ncbi:MAG: ATP-binding protein [Ruminococcus sp.]|nr:ATP-binding protein [Ruminococcus sp.]
MKELELEALTDNLSKVQAFVDEQLEEAGCPIKIQIQIDIAVEEIFINIAHYAYSTETGKATVRIEILPDPPSVDITFIDKGIPYDPLAKSDPDVTLSAEERKIGGLGIFMVKKSMDDVKYQYLDGHNILTLKKGLVI